MRILIIRFSSIGDIVLVSGIIKYLREHIPGITIDILTFTENTDLWKDVDSIYSIGRKTTLKDYRLFLKSMPSYDKIFDLHDNIRSKIALYTLNADEKQKYKKQSLKRRLYVKFRLFKNDLNKHVAQKYAQAVLPAFNLTMPALEELRPYYKNNKNTNPKKIVIHPFASKFTKTWKNFSQFINILSQYKEYNIFIVGKGDITVPKNVTRVNTATLNELIEFISDATLMISTDSGPMHIAVALNIPLIAIFGSTVKEMGFYPEFSKCAVIEKNLKCRPCHIHGMDSCPIGSFECMDIAPEICMAELWKILKK